MGVHTGDSYCVAPMLTIDPKLQARLQDYSYRIVEAIGVIGGTNIQFAHDPEDGPRRHHRDQPAHLALVGPGLQGHRLPHRARFRQTRRRPHARRNPLLARRHAGEIHPLRRLCRGEVLPLGLREIQGLEDKLGTQMRAVGEVMSIGKTYKEAFQKAIRSLENGRHGLGFAKDFNQRPLAELMTMLNEPSQRAAVDHVRGAPQRRHGGGTLRQDLHQALVHPADEGAGRTGGADPRVQGQGAARRPARPGEEGRFRRQVSQPAARRRRSEDPRAAQEARAASRPGMPCPSAASRTRPITIRPTTGPTRCPPVPARRSWCSAAARTASARGSSSTTAASMPPSPCAMPATRPSWSTATRRPFPPTTTPPTSSTSSR